MTTDSERIAELEADLARLRRLITGPVQLEDIRVEDGRLRLAFGDHWATRLLAENFAGSLGDAPNYFEVRFDNPRTGEAFSVTIRREHDKTPRQQLDEYKAAYYKMLLRLLGEANRCMRAGKTPWDVDLDAFLAKHAPQEAPPPERVAVPAPWAVVTSDGFRCGAATPLPSPASASVISAVMSAFAEEHKGCQEGDAAILGRDDE